MSRSSDEYDDNKPIKIKKDYSGEHRESRGDKRRRDQIDDSPPRRDRQRHDRSRDDDRGEEEGRRRNRHDDRRHDRDDYRRRDRDDEIKVKRERRDDRDDDRRRHDREEEVRVKRERRDSSDEDHKRHARNGDNVRRDRDDGHRRPEREPKRERDRSESQENTNNDRPQRRGNWNGPRGGKAKPVWGKPDEEKDIPDKRNKQLLDKDGKPIEKEMPNFEKSGKLTEHTNTFNGIVIKYNEPPEARVPKKKWRLYVFKGTEQLQIMHIHRQSGFLIGRERKCCDIPLDHPSISQQHAVLQYRSRPFVKSDGRKTRAIYPYIIDLNSSNGTFLNNEKIEPQIYIQLKEADVIKFGFSTREYVILNDNSTEAALDKSEDESAEDE